VDGFLDLMAPVDAEQRLEASIFTSKSKGSREVKNLECTINYDPGVLVLVGARQGGTCCDIMVPRFCGLVLLGYLGFLLFLGVAGVFPLFHLFPLLVSFLYTSCMLKGAFTLFINFLLTYKKKLFSTCQYIHVCVCVCVCARTCVQCYFCTAFRLYSKIQN